MATVTFIVKCRMTFIERSLKEEILQWSTCWIYWLDTHTCTLIDLITVIFITSQLTKIFLYKIFINVKMELFSSQSKAFTFEIVQFSDCDTSQETLSISFCLTFWGDISTRFTAYRAECMRNINVIQLLEILFSELSTDVESDSR